LLSFKIFLQVYLYAYNVQVQNPDGLCLRNPVSMPNPGLYAITPDGISNDPNGLNRVRQVITGGAVLLQYRDDSADYKQRVVFAGLLAGLCADLDCPLIINNDVPLAADCGAAGVHLGAADMDISKARAELGAGAIIGASCYNQLDRGAAAVAAGASYLAFGSVYPSPTKPGAVHCPVSTLRLARQRFSLPLVAIGGITVENGAALLSADVDYLAVIGGLFVGHSEHIQAQRYTQLFDHGTRK
jgi:thiamine-phosphate pyrophosphorylase